MSRFPVQTGAACLCLLAAGRVAAQTSPPDGKRPAPSWTGADVVVTGQRPTYAVPDTGAATRTDTPLIEVPQSVQVLNRTLIEEQILKT